MKLENLSPKEGSRRRRRRVGRGIAAGKGASCGFGMRGQKSRSGTGTKAGFEGGQMPLYRRVPKLKHFTVVNRKHYTIVNVEALAVLPANTEVTLASLMEQGIVTSNDGALKILGNGDLSIALNVKAAAFTKSAIQKIEAAGGSCTLITTEISSSSFVASKTPKYTPRQTSPKPLEQSALKKDKSVGYNGDGGENFRIEFTMSVNTTPINKGYRSFFYNKNLDDFILNNEKSEEIKISIEDNLIDENDSSENVALIYLKKIFNEIYSRLFSSNEVIVNNCKFHHLKTVNFPLNKKSIVKFNQYCFDFPVYASTSSVTLDKHNNLISIQSNIGQLDEKIDLAPKYDYKEIIKKIESNLEFKITSEDESKKLDAANLQIYFNPEQEKWSLVYIIQNAVKTVYDKKEKHSLPEIVDLAIDSKSGEIVNILHRTQ